ncbi:dynein light chain Tctex-type protein 2B-like [Coccinella septempunctata]|uniref:dynein light chain Tctex-type protein 2B-like n=1 Tax=Coccinella septempunctata TaxID=41139 RepID=UPI001D099BE3|nr:dynein light chain Tctex-type protein 2B-like [Coccinella septempunctata]
MGEREEIEASDAISVEGSDLTKGNDNEEVEIFKEQSYESIPALHSYQIKPSLLERFKAAPVKEIIRTVQAEVLTGKVYSADNAKKWSIKIANEVNKRCKDLKMRRYKHIAQVILGELKGAGVKSVVRCVWDSETDGYTSDIFMNDSIVCVTVVFALFLY